MREDEVLKGTTTVGIVCKDGVVLGAEHRATMGTLIAHKNTQKVFKVSDRIGLTVAGLVGDAQLLARYLKAEVELYNLNRDTEMTVKAASTLMANILAGSRYLPYWVQLLIGGWDKDGGHVFSLDAAGGAIEDVYTSTGSGSPYVFGVLEDHFTEGISVDEGTALAIRSLTAALKRDAASGNGMSIVAISTKGYKELTEKEIADIIKKYKIKAE